MCVCVYVCVDLSCEKAECIFYLFFSVLRSSETTKVGQIQVWWRSGVQSSPVKWVNVRKCWEEWKTLQAQFVPLKVPCVSFHTTFNIRTCAQWTKEPLCSSIRLPLVNWQKRKPQTAAEKRKNKSEPNDTSKHQKQDLEEDQNPEHSAKNRQREERRGRREVGGWSAREFQTFHRLGWISRAEHKKTL